MISTNTPDNINDLSFDDVVKLIHDDGFTNLPKPVNRMKIIRLIFQVLGYDLSSDAALALCAEPIAQLIIATAGGGKTTNAQINAILQKIWRPSRRNPSKKISGDKILCLVYNKHNVKPMEDKHKALVNRLRMANFSDLKIDDEINASTMHSFCDQIRKENVAKMQLMGFRLQKDTEALTLMRMVKTKMINKYNVRSNPMDEDILALYNYAKESMLEVDKLKETDKFQEVNLPLNVLADIFRYYEKLKKAKKRYDYVDLLTSVYELLSTDKSALQATQRYYEYVIADEVQDFTPIMMSILQLMVSNGTPLMCIGDEDQGIYNFRGADIYNTLDFSNKFPGGEVYSLTRNRRCRKEILDFAKGVIEENKIRYNKIIEGVKDGGSVEMIPYSSIESEHLKIVSMIRNLSEADLNNSVICYRDRYSSIMLAEMLAEANIPFNIISGFEAYSHILYKDLIEIFNALESPFDKALSISLYKVLPVKKDKMFSVFGYDPALRRFRTDDKKHFASYDYGDAMAINGFADNLEVLNRLSVEIQDGTMDRVFPTIFQMLKKYHWNYLRRDREKIAIYDDFIEDRVDKVFNQHRTYKAIFEQLSQKMERCRRNNRNKEGITLATFHGLKGLEFKNCYLMDLDNGRFPNFSLIDSKPYKEEVKEALKECETRLFYVAATRAKDNLIMFYYEDNPSRYLLKYLKGNQLIESNEDVQPKELLVTVQEEDNEIEDDSLLELLDDYDDSASSNTDPITGTDAEDDLLELLTEFDDVKVKQEPTVLQNVDVNNVNVSSTSSSSSYIGKVIGNLSKAGVFGGK